MTTNVTSFNVHSFCPNMLSTQHDLIPLVLKYAPRQNYYNTPQNNDQKTHLNPNHHLKWERFLAKKTRPKNHPQKISLK